MDQLASCELRRQPTPTGDGLGHGKVSTGHRAPMRTRRREPRAQGPDSGLLVGPPKMTKFFKMPFARIPRIPIETSCTVVIYENVGTVGTNHGAMLGSREILTSRSLLVLLSSLHPFFTQGLISDDSVTMASKTPTPPSVTLPSRVLSCRLSRYIYWPGIRIPASSTMSLVSSLDCALQFFDNVARRSLVMDRFPGVQDRRNNLTLI